MRRARGIFVMGALAGIALSVGSAPAAAESKKAVHARIHDAVVDSLPDDLELVAISTPDRALRHLGRRPSLEIDWRTPPREGMLSVQIVAQRRRRRGRSSDRRFWARVELARRQPTLVAVRALPRGAIIGPDDLRVDFRGVRRRDRRHRLAPEPRVFVGAVTRRAIAAGEIVDSFGLPAPPPIRRGTVVDVVVRSGRMRIDTRGTLETVSRVGTRVAVRLHGSRRVVRGQMRDRKTVELEAGQ